MAKKIKGRPEELDFDSFFANNRDNQFHGTYPRGLKVPDKPEIINVQGLDPTGSLRVNTNPGGGEFFIVNGQGNEISFGTAPLTITDMDIGSYDYVVRLEGYKDYRESIQINQGQICCLTVDLEAQEKKEQCVTQPVTPPTGIPQSQSGYIVLKERDFYGALGMLVGLIVGAAIVYLLLRKK